MTIELCRHVCLRNDELVENAKDGSRKVATVTMGQCKRPRVPSD